MCGRFANSRSPAEIRKLFRTINPLPDFQPSWNIAPSQEALVVRRNPETAGRHLDPLKWGLVPHWAKDITKERKPINARCETAATAPMFRSAYRSRRCLVPADAFYEWQTTNSPSKQPYAIARQDGQPLAMAGLWESWKTDMGKVIRSFAILTTAANDDMAPIHDRMPVIIEPDDWPLWLGEVNGDPAELMRPAESGLLRTWRISPAVNSPRNNRADLLEPV